HIYNKRYDLYLKKKKAMMSASKPTAWMNASQR
ncbi:MAG: hypothetical protein JWO83_4448, partial [Caulobacteraceae bacterium]|nr:hypothetical protein [Caulobacteraceae bacterium]